MTSWLETKVVAEHSASRVPHFIQRLSFAWGLVAAIAVLSLTPRPEEILPLTVWDKLSHALAYAARPRALPPRPPWGQVDRRKHSPDHRVRRRRRGRPVLHASALG
jgi:hypothetical protein